MFEDCSSHNPLHDKLLYSEARYGFLLLTLPVYLRRFLTSVETVDLCGVFWLRFLVVKFLLTREARTDTHFGREFFPYKFFLSSARRGFL
jgi:hypothetical protein